MKKLLSILLVATLVLAACTPAAPTAPADTPTPGTGTTAPETTPGTPPPPAADRDDHLIIAAPGFPLSMDTSRSNDFNSSLVNRQIAETLVIFEGPNFNIVPHLAEDWHMPDAQTLVMNLRRDVYFHNGDQMLASDVKFSIERSLESPVVRFIIDAIENVDVIDDHTVQINLRFPFVPILGHLTHLGSAIVSERAVLEAGEDFANHPIGTGPFMFDSMTLGDEVTLVRFEDYWGPAPGVDRISFRTIPEGTNRLIEVETGVAHIAFDISPHHLARMQDDPSLDYNRSTNVRIHFMGFNNQSGSLQDVRVRQAINYAIDVDAIVANVFQGLGVAAHGPLVTIPAAIDLNLYQFNLERARELMAEAGYADGLSLTLWSNIANQQDTDKAVIIQNMLAQIDIDVELVSVEGATFMEGINTGQHDMHLTGWTNVSADPDYGLFPLFHSSAHGSGGNRTFYTNAEFDRLLDLGRQELDSATRLEIYREAQEILINDAPAVFIWHVEELVCLAPELDGFINFPIRTPRLNTVFFN
ncbi:MAG: ABC transporter substrate-binding protein [Defluviitaleaceae bacterium]|nr:ABC transporter substrate-binding protein [Defluviitaleaceae bacterium]